MIADQLAAKDHVDPVLAHVAHLHNVSITTNINYFAPLAVPVHPLDGGTGVAVDEDDLKAFVNSADWSLRPSLVHTI